jgi:hypothetical protein
MKMGRRRTRGLEQLVGRWGIRDLSRLLEEDILVHYHHYQVQCIGFGGMLHRLRPPGITLQ